MTFTVIPCTYLVTAIFLLFSPPCLAQEEYLPYPGIIHIHSHVSQGGVYSPRRLVGLAQGKGIKILVFSDTFLRLWEYGLPLFSGIFKVSREKNSVVKYGIKRYLEDLKKTKDEFPDMLILEGVEITPFYWWSGNFFKKNLTLNDWNRHLLVVGLKKYKDYARLPVVCNRYFFPQFKDIPSLLIPLSLIILGISILKKRKQKKFLGFILNIIGILFLLNFLPFSASRYSPYRGQRQFFPYQDLINYVNKRGGLVFWAHPEVTELASQGRFLTIGFYTPSYPESLILTSGYTGFGVNMQPGTNHNLILSGREWDNVLRSYCEGKRSQPAWVIAEADYRGKGKIDSVQNIFLLSEFKVESVRYALRHGKLYIRYYSQNNIDISLSDFYIEDSRKEATDKSAFTPLEKVHSDKESSLTGFMGDEIEIKGKPRLHIKGSYIINPPEDLELEIIRDGEIIKKFEFTPLEKAYPIKENSLTGFSNEKVFDLEFQDDSLKIYNRKSYYRLNFFAGSKIILVTNPIFVEIRDGY